MPISQGSQSGLGDASSNVVNFYNSVGWHLRDGIFGDARLWEDARRVSSRYQAQCRLRLSKRLRPGRRLLDAGCGAVQHPEYLKLHHKFAQVDLVDISQRALDAAPSEPQYVKTVADMACLPFDHSSFDAACAINSLNHVAKERQELTVLELIRVLKPGGKVVFVLYNPNRRKFGTLAARGKSQRNALYWHSPSLEWWDRFETLADVATWPYRLLFVTDLLAVPDNLFGRTILRALSLIEGLPLPFLKRKAAYYGVTLTKKMD